MKTKRAKLMPRSVYKPLPYKGNYVGFHVTTLQRTFDRCNVCGLFKLNPKTVCVHPKRMEI